MEADELDGSLQSVMGWGQYEAAAYRVLVRYGPLEASDVVVRANIPQGRVYDVLNRLDSEGAVITRGAQPTQYAAQSPRKLIEPRREEFDERATTTIEKLEPAYEMNIQEEQHPAWVTTNISGIATQVREMFDGVENRLWLMEREIWFEDADITQLQRLAAQGVDVRVLGWRARQEQGLQDIKSDAGEVTVRQLDQVGTSFYVGDDDRVILNLDDGSTGVVFSDEGMASVLSERFNDLYNDAREVPLNNE